MKLWEWLRRAVVQEVPPADVACEFECRIPQCLHSRWEACPARLLAEARERAARSA